MEEYIKGLSGFKKPDLKNVRELTSAEYYYDPHTHITTHDAFVSDQIVMSTFRSWIKENEKFIKVMTNCIIKDKCYRAMTI